MDELEDIQLLLESEEVEGCIRFDDLDEAVVGVGTIHGRGTHLIYSEQRIIRCLVEKQAMSPEDAWDWYLHNIQCLYAGERTPMIMREVETFTA